MYHVTSNPSQRIYEVSSMNKEKSLRKENYNKECSALNLNLKLSLNVKAMNGKRKEL